MKQKKMTIKDRNIVKQKELESQIEIVKTEDYSIDEYNKAIKDIELLKELNDGEELPWKIERFCQEYVTHYNEDKAAQKSGWPVWNAMAIGKRLISDPVVQKRIQQLQEFESVKLGINRSRILSEYMKFVNFNVQDLYDENGELIPIEKLDRNIAAVINNLKFSAKKVIDKDGNEKIKTYIKELSTVDKKSALDALAKHLGLFDRDQEREIPVDFKTFFNLFPKEIQEKIKIGSMKRIGSNKK